MSSLSTLHTVIENRVATIRSHTPDWLCGKGCANCCRSLAQIPQLTESEWTLLQEGLAALTPEVIAQIKQNVTVLAQQSARPFVCPLLDQATNACPVYAQRPIACRTYGFYVQRELGLYCADIEAQVTDGLLADVVWGNHDVIDQTLATFGETRALTDWFELAAANM